MPDLTEAQEEYLIEQIDTEIEALFEGKSIPGGMPPRYRDSPRRRDYPPSREGWLMWKRDYRKAQRKRNKRR